MMALARGRRDSGMNYWPGFVDALSTLILSIIFLLIVFVVAQFFLPQEVSGKDTALARLNAQISALTELLSLEQTGKTSLEDADRAICVRASRHAEERARPAARRHRRQPAAARCAARREIGKLSGRSSISKSRLTARAVAQVELLNQQIAALRRQLAALEDALDASEKKDKESQPRSPISASG